MYDRNVLIDTAIGQAESFRNGDEESERDLEIGHLYGMADLITALTLQDNESFSDIREDIARRIDRGATKTTYPLLDANK